MMIVRCPWGECKEALTHRVGPKGSIFTLLAPPEEGGTRCAPLTADLLAPCTQRGVLGGASGSGLGGSVAKDLGNTVALGTQGLGALRVTQSLDDAGEVAERNDEIVEGFGNPKRIRKPPRRTTKDSAIAAAAAS